MFWKIKKKDSPIRKNFIYIQLVTILTIVVLLGVVSMEFSKSVLLNQLENDAKHYGGMTGKYIEQNQITNNIINKNMEDLAYSLSAEILNSKKDLSNVYLKDISRNFGVDAIYYYSPTGTIIYSSDGEYIGWKAKPGDPIYLFMNSGKNIFNEDIRKSTDSDEYYKFSYFKDDNGNFVQIGFLLDNIEIQTKKYDFQTIVNDITTDDKIYYSLIIDNNLIGIADSNLENVGMDWSKDSNYQKALKGETVVVNIYDEDLKENVLKIIVPIVSDGQISELLVIGHSLDSLNDLVSNSSIRILITLLVISAVILYSQWKFMINPINLLNNQLIYFDFIKKGHKLKIKQNDPFKGVYLTINNLLARVDEYINKNIEMKEYVEYEAYHDELTNLENRRALYEELDRILKDNISGSVCMIDLNNLKEINDIYGHITGDEILKNIAHRFRGQIDEQIKFYRFGGDEFIAIILGDKDCIKKKYKRIFKSISKPIKNEMKEFEISFCLGISSFPKDGRSKNELISKADIAMYYVKKNLGSGFAYFRPFMQKKLNRRSEINNILKEAIKGKGFNLLYQPIYNTHIKCIAYYEALIRLDDYQISPIDFIKVAEDKGLIIEIGRFVIREAIKQLYKWKLKGIELKTIAVNLSPNQIKDKKLVKYILALLAEYDIEAKYLEIEITEDIFIENSLEVVAFLESLKNIGLKVTLDDFGSGYSSLTYLTFMPIDKIKLDKILIDKYLTKEKLSIIKNIINIAHDLNLLVVGEGIETADQYDMLKEMDCDFIQGYYFSKPVNCETIEKMLLNKTN
ncbi:MAG: bifunctional diguanylate cyclase/phosphodiesterase [Firmicutes bacterium]|nr:bifunctional diguanylate cyclase/phosphodiesterase [Bacillota bacterium]